ncbi:hypothetical protein ACTL4S_07765 [Acinetobacter lwoffii]|uniref:hypothetical protein n=1 Tax=Acinetobacter TaxID=469 RepID=UPI0025777C58|nr:hypothetical protein [Acinetobacter pseudolwoffii]MDM1324884.1 hypothetical protein [Acinetobacter pseudolwoffii]
MTTSAPLIRALPKYIFCILLPIVCAYLFYNYAPFSFYADNTQTSQFEIAKFTATISATLLGFLLTAIAVLTALMDKTLIANMRKTGHYPKFLRLALFTSSIFLIVTILAFLVLLLYRTDFSPIAFSLMIGYLVLSFLLLIRTGYSFFKIIYNV